MTNDSMISLMTFKTALSLKNEIQKELDESLRELSVLSGEEKGFMGLTPDRITQTPEWQSAYKKVDGKRLKVMHFNNAFIKKFKSEFMALSSKRHF